MSKGEGYTVLIMKTYYITKMKVLTTSCQSFKQKQFPIYLFKSGHIAFHASSCSIVDTFLLVVFYRQLLKNRTSIAMYTGKQSSRFFFFFGGGGGERSGVYCFKSNMNINFAKYLIFKFSKFLKSFFKSRMFQQ